MSETNRVSSLSYQRVCGVDVAKRTLQACIITPEQTLSQGVANTPEGVARLIKLCLKHEVQLIVFEATGGLERLLSVKADAAKIPFALANPACVRHYALAEKRMAKTDKVDAQIIGQYGIKIAPAPTPLRNESQEKLLRLATRRDQLIRLRTAELNRQTIEADPDNLLSIKASLKNFGRQIDKADLLLDAQIKTDPVLDAKAQAADQTVGIGRVSAVALVAYMPEIGNLTRRQVTALAGLAPYDNQSGDQDSPAHISGGRSAVRRTLYMCAMTAVRFDPKIKAFYLHLLAKGKEKMVAMTACMRKLLVITNARVKERMAAQAVTQPTAQANTSGPPSHKPPVDAAPPAATVAADADPQAAEVLPGAATRPAAGARPAKGSGAANPPTARPALAVASNKGASVRTLAR